MNRILVASTVAIACAFAGCSKQPQSTQPTADQQPRDGGVDQRRPSLDQIVASLREGSPDHLMVTATEHSFTPMKEYLGTTLPEGSWLVTLKAQIAARELLYVSFAPAMESAPAGARANLETMEEMRVLARWGSANPFDEKMKARTVLLPCMIEAAGPGDMREEWMKVRAEPQGGGWLFEVIDGDVARPFGKALPAGRLSSNLLKFESAEQRQNLDAVRQEYAAWKRRQEVAARIAPEVDQVLAGEAALAQQYYSDAQMRLATLEAEFKAKFSALEARKDQLFRAMSNDSSQWGERDRLISEATVAFEQWRATWEPKRVACESERDGSAKKALEDTKKKIADLYRREGIEP